MSVKVQIQLLDDVTGEIIGDANPVTIAELVKFADGETFQEKLDTGKLKGQTGDTGATGAAGATWLTGTATPTPAQGKDGDWYLNTANCDIYQKASGAWSKKGNIKGAQGIQGIQGVKGDTGKQGIQGIQGEKGDPGDTVKVGTSTSTAVQRKLFFEVIG